MMFGGKQDCRMKKKKVKEQTSKVAQGAKALDAKPDNLNLNPKTHMTEGENQLHKLFSDLCESTTA